MFVWQSVIFQFHLMWLWTGYQQISWISLYRITHSDARQIYTLSTNIIKTSPLFRWWNEINDNLIMPHERCAFYHIRRWIINDRCQLWANKDHSNQFCVNWMNTVVMFPAESTLLLLACAFIRLSTPLTLPFLFLVIC